MTESSTPVIKTRACARAALAGNPSDGYFGRTLSYTVREFQAQVLLHEAAEMEVVPAPSDEIRHPSLEVLVDSVRRNGYYGAERLVLASLVKFHQYCQEAGLTLPRRNCSIRYQTAIPRGVGLAGSSAIVTATWRALMQFYEVAVPLPILPNWVLSTERDELKIMAGLQDRVAQSYEGLVYMDFDQHLLSTRGYGEYERLPVKLMPPLYLAYRTAAAEPSDVVHNDLRERWDRGDAEVHAAMEECADLARAAREALLSGRAEEFSALVDANYDVRKRILQVAPAHHEMVQAARRCGASANFAGSGGAITGVCGPSGTTDWLRAELSALGCEVIWPTLVDPIDSVH